MACYHVNKGYTLIEIVTVILMLAVLSLYAAPRLSGTDEFHVQSARDSGLSVARQVQMRSMQDDIKSPTSCNVLQMQSNRFGAKDTAICNPNAKRSDILDLSQSSVLISNPQTVYFDLLGRPFGANGNRLCVNSEGQPKECKFTFTKGSAIASICLNSEGYFYVCT